MKRGAIWRHAEAELVKFKYNIAISAIVKVVENAESKLKREKAILISVCNGIKRINLT